MMEKWQDIHIGHKASAMVFRNSIAQMLVQGLP